jgi:hypothetical protein
MGEGGAAIVRDLQDLFDQVLELSPVQWGFVVIAAAAAFAWIWVMGAPKDERRPVLAGAAAAVAGVAVGLALVLLAPHPLAV